LLSNSLTGDQFFFKKRRTINEFIYNEKQRGDQIMSEDEKRKKNPFCKKIINLGTTHGLRCRKLRYLKKKHTHQQEFGQR
jgi:uncharacterized membrane protein YukC